MIAPRAAPATGSTLAQIEQHGEPFSCAAAVPETLQVAAGQLPLGTVLHVMHCVRIASLGEVRAWRLAGTGGSIGVRSGPAGNRDMTVRAARSEPAAREQLPAS